MKRLNFDGFLSFFFFAACQPAVEKEINEGQAPKGAVMAPSEAAIFQPNIVSSELPEFAIAVHEDILFFNRTAPDRSTMRLLYSKKEGDRWSVPDARGLYRRR